MLHSSLKRLALHITECKRLTFQRAEALADEIVRASPDLVGLQEAALFRTQIPADGPATPATNVSYDFIQILIDALEDRVYITQRQWCKQVLT
jgi:hypothetical protein